MLHKIIITALNNLGYESEPLENDNGTITHIFIYKKPRLKYASNTGHITLNDYPQALHLYKNTNNIHNYQEITQADPELIKKLQEFYGPATQRPQTPD